jgi:cytochrome c oxidase subunit III
MPLPAISTSIPHPTQEPGLGGKPPDHRPPTGGGGGGGGGDDGSSREPRTAIHRTRTFLFALLAADLLLFVVAVVVFYAKQGSPPPAAGDAGRPLLLLPKILLLNTLALFASSLTMECARRHIFDEIDALEEWFGLGRPALAHSLPWIATTAALGLLFLSGQFFVWRQFLDESMLGNRAIASACGFFALLTGLHAAHIALGLLALLLCLTTLRWLPRLEFRQIAIDAAAWFWHAMSLTWCILLLVLVIG